MKKQDLIQICVVRATFRLNLKEGFAAHKIEQLIPLKAKEEAPQLFHSAIVTECMDIDNAQSQSVERAVVLEMNIPCGSNCSSISQSNEHILRRFVCAIAKELAQDKVRVLIGNAVRHWDPSESEMCHSDSGAGFVE